MTKRVYLAGPMTGIPEFNFPAFTTWSGILRDLGYVVFSPAERDCEYHGVDISAGNHTGSVEQAEREHGLSVRRALNDDMTWICQHATAIALMPGWERSNGARAEHALATALGLEFIYLQ